MRFKLLLPLVVIALLAILVSLCPKAHAEDMRWETPLGTFGLPLKATEALIGYDAVLKQAIAGASVPVYSTPKNLVVVQVGAVGPWPTNKSTVEPYIAAGHDVLRDIPELSAYQAAHLNVFGRWATEYGKAGVGLAFSYAPGASSTAPSLAPAPAVPLTSKLNLFYLHSA